VVDLYVFGFPCQPFSPAGKGKVLDDPRGMLLKYCVDYVQEKQPLLVIAENSSRLASRKFTDTRNMMVSRLETCGYRVHWAVLNTKEQGLPQSRPRFYLVACLSPVKPFTFSPKIDPVPLRRLLEAPGATPAASGGKTAKAKDRIRMHVDAARLKLEARGLRAWAQMMNDCSPCLTAQRCMQVGGHYLLRFGCTMTEKEVCRLQGIPDGRVDYVGAKVTKAKFLHAVGNAMSSNVLARILAHALPAAGLSKPLKAPDADVFLKHLVRD
jgi:site-specific DNA-cytosine methylase